MFTEKTGKKETYVSGDLQSAPVHIEKLPNRKGWRAHVSVHGRRRSVTRRTRGEAVHAGAELELEMGGIATSRGATVGELVAGHLAEANWSPTTMTDARRVVDKLPDTFTRRPVRDVTPAIIDGLYRQLARDGWTAHRIRRAHMVLSVSFKDAARYGWCHHNPCTDANPPSPDQARIHAPDHQQVATILDHATSVFLVYLRVAVCTGARRGETVALRWDDVDLTAGEVLIARSIVSTAGGTYTERPTKTGAKAHRRLALDADVVTALRRHKAEQSDAAARRQLPAPEFVFSHDAGITPWRPDYVSREFRLTCAKAGVSGVRLHDCRHYVATTMLGDGEAAIDVAHQLGHSTVATTLSTYASYMPGRGRDSAERRAKRLHHDER